MKQYRYTSADVNTPNSDIPDAFMEDSDLARLRQLAGLVKPNLLKEYTTGSSDPQQHTPNDNSMPAMSPVGSNISITGMEKQRLEKDLNIRPGSPEWFRLWFSRPYLTGEKPVGDDEPVREENPSYLLDKNGQVDADKASDLADQLIRRRDES